MSCDNFDRFPAWNETFNGGNSLPSTGNTHRWSDANNPNLQAMCAQKVGDVASSAEQKYFDHAGFTFHPAVIKGTVSNTTTPADCQPRGVTTPLRP